MALDYQMKVLFKDWPAGLSRSRWNAELTSLKTLLDLVPLCAVVVAPPRTATV